MFEQSIYRRLGFTIQLLAAYFLSSVFILHIYIGGAVLGLIAIRIMKIAFDVLINLNSKFGVLIGLALETAIFIVSAILICMFDLNTYNELLVSSLLILSVIAIDLMIVEPISFGV